MPKATKKVKINVRKEQPRQIFDADLLKSGKPDRIFKIVAWAAALGLVVGGGLLAYVFFAGNPLGQEFAPEIIVPPVPSADETSPPAQSEPAVTIQQIAVLDTPTGYLNVRAGPGTNYPLLGRINPGESYELVSETPENGGWYEIRLSLTQTGWVTKRYAQIK